MLRCSFITLLTACLFAGTLPAADRPVSFVHDVMPQLTKAGCASGNCHAKPEGQNNFKLSVFGYDPKLDYYEIIRDDRGRRVLFAAPEESLLLKKATGAVPHEGGARMDTKSPAYQTLLAWIQQGAPFALENEAKLASVSVEPREQSYKKGASQELKVTAKYSDGSTRDVTDLTEYLSQDKEMATVDEHGHVKVGTLSGEGVIVVRYMGLVDVARVTVPAEKTYPADRYAKLPVNNEIDRLVHEKHQKLGLLPSATCTDEEFIRRVSLDLIGKQHFGGLSQHRCKIGFVRHWLGRGCIGSSGVLPGHNHSLFRCFCLSSSSALTNASSSFSCTLETIASSGAMAASGIRAIIRIR